MKRTIGSVVLASALAACGPIKGNDAGTQPHPDAAAQEAGPCTADGQFCATTTTCCTLGYVCAAASNVCGPPCVGVDSICSDNSNCCSGICNGTCQ